MLAKVNAMQVPAKFCKHYGPYSQLYTVRKRGDFLLHIKTIEELLPVFCGCDSLNYLRYGSFYLELLKRLKHTNPELYDFFMRKHFVVKRKPGSFNSVAPDLALEQTIQRSAKSSSGIIGKTKSNECMAEWALIYHEVLAVTNTLREITNADQGGNTETISHDHHLRPSRTKEINKHTDSITAYINSQGNPFLEQNLDKVKNIITQVYAEDDVAEMHANFSRYLRKDIVSFTNLFIKTRTSC